MKEVIRDVVHNGLLQSGLFEGVIDLNSAADKKDYIGSSAYEYAIDHNLRYIIDVNITAFINPGPNGDGFCALIFQIKRAKDRVTIFRSYGETALKSFLEEDYVLFKHRAQSAPSALQGILSILNANAKWLRSHIEVFGEP